MIIGSGYIFRKNLDSTNSYAHRLMNESQLPEGTIIYTNYQTTGRGRKGHSWESEDGKNLLFSIILFPNDIPAGGQFVISMMISLGICDFLGRFVTDLSIKWPNDIYVGYDKIAGILIENSLSGNTIESTIAGIGVNINQEEFLSDAPNPVSVKMLTGKSHDTGILLKQLAGALDKRYRQLLSGKQPEIRRAYNASLFRLGEWVSFKTGPGTIYGRILSVTDTGLLRIEDSYQKIHEFSFGEIDLMP